MVSPSITLSPSGHTNHFRNFIFNKKYSTRDIGKYRLLEAPQAHPGAAKHLLGDGEDYFGGLQNRFSRHMHRFLGDQEEAPHAPQQSEGAHIQLTRRYGDHAQYQVLR